MNPDNKKAGEEMVFDKYVAIALVVGIVAGFIIGNSVGASKNKVDTAATSTSENMIFGDEATSTSQAEETDTSPMALVETDKLSVKDQKAGHYVVLSNLTLDKTYWVAVQDSRTTNTKTYILGAKKIMPGTYTDNSIYVSRATEAGKSYDVVFYQDRGDFNYSPSLLVTEKGQPIGATFKAN
jgi:hypothetical protein